MDFFTHVGILAALAVVLVQQILKLNLIPLSFANKYPVPTNILLSIIASIVAVWRTSVSPHSWTDWVLLVATISVVSSLTYRVTLHNWAELRAMEGAGTKATPAPQVQQQA